MLSPRELKSELLPYSKSMGERRARFEMPDFVSLSATEKGNDGTFCAKRITPLMNIEKAEDLKVVAPEQVDDLSWLGAANDPDASEYSSSFGNSFSGSDLTGEEMDSQFHGVNAAFTFSDGFNKLVRKKKLTEHWRRFILPLMWRCQWIELRMKELRSQDLKYEKELSAYDQEKLMQEKMVALDKSAAGAVSLTHQTRMKLVMRRRKRKRIEKTVDILSYMSSHNIFSYYERGFKDVDLFLDGNHKDQVSVVSEKHNIKDCHDLGACYEWPMLDFSYGDNSLEKILFDIEAMKSRVFKLRTQFNEVICGLSGKVSTSSSCPLEDPPYSGAQEDPPYHCALNPSCSPVSSNEADAPPDIIEITMDLLSSAINASLDQHQIGGLGNELVDDLLINNPAAEEELQSFRFIHGTENAPPDAMKENENAIAATVSETELRTKRSADVLEHRPQSDLQIRRSKRKRVERTRSPGWNGEKIRRRKSSKA